MLKLNKVKKLEAKIANLNYSISKWNDDLMNGAKELAGIVYKMDANESKIKELLEEIDELKDD